MEILRRSFDAVTIIDTDAFVKTHRRRQAFFTNEGKLVWRSHLTEEGALLDELLLHNVAAVHSEHIYLERFHSENRLAECLTTMDGMKNGNHKAVQGGYLR